MKAALLHGVRDVRTGDKPDVSLKKGELLLKPKAVSVCGSDLHYYLEGGIGSAKVGAPMVLGHEFSAEVVDERAEDFGLQVGTLVAVDPALPCGECEWCERGHANLCPNVEFTGSPPFDGAMREFLGARPENLFPVPGSFDAATAALLEPLGVAIHALDLARLKPMESVAVLGAGPIGLLLMQVAKHAGAGEVYAIDPLSYRIEVAKRLGADRMAESHEAVADWTNGRGVDVVLEATNSPHGPQHAAEAVRIGGRLILVGIPEGDTFTMIASHVRRKGLTIKLSRRMGHVYPRAIQMVERGLVDVTSLVTHRFGLEQAGDAFELQAEYRDGVIKSVIDL